MMQGHVSFYLSGAKFLKLIEDLAEEIGVYEGKGKGYLIPPWKEEKDRAQSHGEAIDG